MTKASVVIQEAAVVMTKASCMIREAAIVTTKASCVEHRASFMMTTDEIVDEEEEIVERGVAVAHPRAGSHSLASAKSNETGRLGDKEGN
jgi:precorrin-4 methylase